jgi:citrate lyase subunit beta/citryl-CoA lyase
MARANIVLASTAARLEPPLDSPWLKIADLDGLRAAAERARADGFGGMLVIHPSHVTTLNQVFSPSANELAWARAIVASSAEAESGGRGAYTHDGQMVDEAIVKRARAILRDAQP